jgi:flagellar basal-body rod modification protein FlgD
MNSQLTTLIGLQQSAQSSEALNYVGATVVVKGSTVQMANNAATWDYNPTAPANATFTVTNSTGQTVFTQTGTVQAGNQTFNWNGVGNNGQQWPAGAYTLSITATSASGKSVGVSTQVQGVVSSVDLTQSPPVLTVGGQQYPVNQIQQIIASSSTNASNSLASALSALGL